MSDPLLESLTWDQLRPCRMVVPDHVAHRALAQETVLLNVTTGTYYSLDQIGARFFEVLQDALSCEAASEALAAEFAQPLDRITADLLAFTEQLRQRGLITIEPPRG